MPHPLSVLLIAPGSLAGPDSNFGDPHLVGLGSFLQAQTGAEVEIVDLDYEPFLPHPDPERIFDRRHAVVGLSCYSSYDYLKTFYLGAEIRRRHPGVILVAGGYHPSARPDDFLNLPGSPLGEASPFDYVVVGEGEIPLSRIVAAAGRGERWPQPVLGPEPVADLDTLPPMNWGLLERYRPVARAIAGQANLYLSRGCPFRCSFCMERAKGESRWRAWSPARAESEIRALDQWLGLKGWKLFLTGAVFGLDAAWRREMLDRVARLELGLDKIWTLGRVDALGEGDLARFHRAGFGLGFGLESGDPNMLALIGKAPGAPAFLERFVAMAEEAATLGFPWGANLITGHPGETAATLENSARFVRRLFLETKALTGFLSVDPFRFYPGSAVDHELDRYQREFGTRVHRPRWWNYSEQAFCSEWVDPSADLDYRRKEELAARLFAPLAEAVARRFDYRGPAGDYFRRSVEHSATVLAPPARLRTLHDYLLWRRLTGQSTASLLEDPTARQLFREARRHTLESMPSRAAPRADSSVTPGPSRKLCQALLEEPRERYLPADQVLESWQDQSVPLTRDQRSTLSALHAYATNFTLLALEAGDRLLDVGGGTGYGAAVAARLVGPGGHVTTVELVPALVEEAQRNLAPYPNVTVVEADATAAGRGPAISLSDFNKVLFSYCLEEVPGPYLEALPEGGRLVAPILAPSGLAQTLTLFTRQSGQMMVSQHGPVVYGQDRNRSAA